MVLWLSALLAEVSHKYSMCCVKHCQGAKYAVVVRLNPKAITASQMYGEIDLMSDEWTTGVFMQYGLNITTVETHTLHG